MEYLFRRETIVRLPRLDIWSPLPHRVSIRRFIGRRSSLSALESSITCNRTGHNVLVPDLVFFSIPPPSSPPFAHRYRCTHTSLPSVLVHAFLSFRDSVVVNVRCLCRDVRGGLLYHIRTTLFHPFSSFTNFYVFSTRSAVSISSTFSSTILPILSLFRPRFWELLPTQAQTEESGKLCFPSNSWPVYRLPWTLSGEWLDELAKVTSTCVYTCPFDETRVFKGFLRDKTDRKWKIVPRTYLTVCTLIYTFKKVISIKSP